MQAKQYEEDKKTAACPMSQTAVVQMDFSENYTCVAQDEIQSAHWNQGQVTLYTSVSWFRDQIISHVVVSDYMHHSKTSTVVFTAEVLAKLPPDVTEVKIWTDGPASQFKNKYVVTAMKELSHNCHDVKLIWILFATSHGKGPVDGVGGTLKRTAANKVRSRQCIINGMTDFVATVKDSSITVTCMTADQVVQHECDLHVENIFKEAKAIKGISNFHCFEWQHDMIRTKQYSSEVPRVMPNVITTAAQNTSSGGEVGAPEAMTGPTVSVSTEISHWYAVY